MRSLPKFDQLVAIYGKDRATGACAETAKEKKRRWEKERSEGVKEAWVQIHIKLPT